ncbi:MAG: TolC family protein, partial [bacterium]
DVVALAIENNIDVEVQRYGPLLAREVLRRAKGGGALRNVGVGVAPGPQSVSLQGVSLNSGGGGSAGAGGNGVSSGGGIVTQLGPLIPSFDPTVAFFANFQHATIPQGNTFLVGTTALIQDTRTYLAQYSQNWSFGLNAQLTYTSTHTKVNSLSFNLNPYASGDLDLQVTQNLLQGFGSAVNERNIRVQRNNLKDTDLQFKQQVIATVSAVLNLYWDLVSFDEDVRYRKQEVATAQQLLDDNKKQVALGALAEIEVTRAESQLYSAQQDLVVSQTNLLQQETVLKNALSRSGVTSPSLAAVHIVPLDKIAVPTRDDIAPLDQLVADALKKRVEIAQSRINIESNKLNLV